MSKTKSGLKNYFTTPKTQKIKDYVKGLTIKFDKKVFVSNENVLPYGGIAEEAKEALRKKIDSKTLVRYEEVDVKPNKAIRQELENLIRKGYQVEGRAIMDYAIKNNKLTFKFGSAGNIVMFRKGIPIAASNLAGEANPDT